MRNMAQAGWWTNHRRKCGRPSGFRRAWTGGQGREEGRCSGCEGISVTLTWSPFRRDMPEETCASALRMVVISWSGV